MATGQWTCQVRDQLAFPLQDTTINTTENARGILKALIQATLSFYSEKYLLNIVNLKQNFGTVGRTM